jgi:hypothetical protein
MDSIIIVINWGYFLGIIGSLIGMAWYANGRFTALETSMRWVTDTLRDLMLGIEIRKSRAQKRNGDTFPRL